MEESGLLEVTSRCCYQKKGELARQNRKVVRLGWINQMSASQLCFLTCGPAAKRTVQNFLYRGSRFESYWKIFFWFCFVISNHTISHAFQIFPPPPELWFPGWGQGRCCLWERRDFGVTQTWVWIPAAPTSICLVRSVSVRMWDYQYLSFRGMVGNKLDDVCKPPAQLQTVNRSQLFLLLF